MRNHRTASPVLGPFSLSLMMVALLQLTGCSGPSVTNAWKDPSLTGPIQFKKTAILVMHPDGAVRRAAEDQLVQQIGADRAVAGYSILTDDDLKDAKTIQAKLQSQNIDGAITMKLAGSHIETTYVPGSSGYPPFGDYYGGYSRAYMASPGMVVSDTIVSVQTNIYSVADGKMIWSGTTDLTNPSDARKAAGEVAKAVGNELRKEKLIQ